MSQESISSTNNLCIPVEFDKKNNLVRKLDSEFTQLTNGKKEKKGRKVPTSPRTNTVRVQPTATHSGSRHRKAEEKRRWQKEGQSFQQNLPLRPYSSTKKNAANESHQRSLSGTLMTKTSSPNWNSILRKIKPNIKRASAKILNFILNTPKSRLKIDPKSGRLTISGQTVSAIYAAKVLTSVINSSKSPPKNSKIHQGEMRVLKFLKKYAPQSILCLVNRLKRWRKNVRPSFLSLSFLVTMEKLKKNWRRPQKTRIMCISYSAYFLTP